MSASTDLSLPRTLGEYELVELLGQGGMGEVYRAHKAGEPDCVVKTVRPDRNTEQETLSRFKDEARVTMMLDHANVARVSDFGRDGDVMYLVMELVEGGSVEDIIARSERLPEVAALRLTIDILLGLDHAHRAVEPGSGAHLGVVHRDVSPQNALVSAEGEVKLIDFGLAMSAVKQTKTADGAVIIAKLQYASPENARGEDVDHRSDQFSASVIAAELLTGERFYGEVGAVELWRLASDGGFRPPHWASISSDVRAILDQALHPRPEKRHINCRKLADALLAIVQQRTGGGDGRADARAALGLADESDGDEPDTVGLDLEEARAIAAIASGEGLTEKVEALDPDEATMIADALPAAGLGVAALDDNEATVVATELPSRSSPSIEALAPDDATVVADADSLRSSAPMPRMMSVDVGEPEPSTDELPGPSVFADSIDTSTPPSPLTESSPPTSPAPSQPTSPESSPPPAAAASGPRAIAPAASAQASGPSAPAVGRQMEVSGPSVVAGGVRPALRRVPKAAQLDEPRSGLSMWQIAGLLVVLAGLLVGIGVGVGLLLK